MAKCKSCDEPIEWSLRALMEQGLTYCWYHSKNNSIECGISYNTVAELDFTKLSNKEKLEDCIPDDLKVYLASSNIDTRFKELEKLLAATQENTWLH